MVPLASTVSSRSMRVTGVLRYCGGAGLKKKMPGEQREHHHYERAEQPAHFGIFFNFIGRRQASD